MTSMRSKRESSMKKEVPIGTAVWLWLTLPIAFLIAIATGSELFVDGLFRGDAPTFVAQAIGQDVITLGWRYPPLR